MRRWIWGLATTVLVVAAAPSATAQDEPPAITVDKTGVADGEPLLVQGTGWTGTDLVYVELCGNGGRGGSRNCDQAGATLAGVSTTGTFGAHITAAAPPVPCPCVVKATSQATQAAATVPIGVQDVPVVALDDQEEMHRIERAVRITDVELRGAGPWTAWLGAGAERTLAFTLENTGDVDIHDPAITIAIGKGATPAGVVRPPEVGTIAAGESLDVEVAVRFDALAFGGHSALVRVDGFADPTSATAKTSIYPWALIAFGLVLVQLALLRIRNRIRRRFEGAEPPLGSEGDQDAAPAHEVLDLRDGLTVAPGGPAPASDGSLEPPGGERPAEPSTVESHADTTAQGTDATEPTLSPARVHIAPALVELNARDIGEPTGPAPAVPQPAAGPNQPDGVDLRAAPVPAGAGIAPVPTVGFVARHDGGQVATMVTAPARPDAWGEAKMPPAVAERVGRSLATAEARVEAERLLRTARAEAVRVLADARRRATAVTAAAERAAEVMRRDAEAELSASRAATATTRADLKQLVSDVRTTIGEVVSLLEAEAIALARRGPAPDGHAATANGDPVSSASPATRPRTPAPRIGRAFEGAIARAVQQALRD